MGCGFQHGGRVWVVLFHIDDYRDIMLSRDSSRLNTGITGFAVNEKHLCFFEPATMTLTTAGFRRDLH